MVRKLRRLLAANARKEIRISSVSRMGHLRVTDDLAIQDLDHTVTFQRHMFIMGDHNDRTALSVQFFEKLHNIF